MTLLRGRQVHLVMQKQSLAEKTLLGLHCPSIGPEEHYDPTLLPMESRSDWAVLRMNRRGA